MSILKKVIIIAAILAAAAINILIYWNQHLYYKSEGIGDSEQRIEVLEKAAEFYPLNDLVFYELGKDYHDLGVNSLGEEGRSSVHLQKSAGYFSRSLRMNPTSYFGHFYLAQAFLNMSFDAPSQEEKAYQEFKKAAGLAGQNSEIYFEIGKIFLSRWPYLSEQDKDFTVDVLKKFLDRGEIERLRVLFNLWQINVDDYEVMGKILPEDPQIYRDYAAFLGEKSLSKEERQKFLAKAEFLEFQKAHEAFEAGKSAFFYYRPKEAQGYFKSCLSILRKIHFYQNLSAPPDQIDSTEYDRLQKLALLDQIKSLLDQGQEFQDVEDSLWEYIAKEESAAAISELETYLKDKGFVEESVESSLNDLGRLSFRLYFSLVQGRYRDNMRIGRSLLQNLFVIPEGKEAQFVKIMETVGESFQRVDFIYDSNDFYKKALEVDPDNLEVLVKLRGNYERLRAADEISGINRKIGEIVSPRGIDVNRTVNKGQTFQRALICDGQEINLNLQFGKRAGDRKPLIAVFFNGRVVWEDYLEGDSLSVPVESAVGGNRIQVVPVNMGVEIAKISYSMAAN